MTSIMAARRSRSVPMLLLFSLHCLTTVNGFSTTRRVRRKSPLRIPTASIRASGSSHPRHHVLCSEESTSEDMIEEIGDDILGVSMSEESYLAFMSDLIEEDDDDNVTSDGIGTNVTMASEIKMEHSLEKELVVEEEATSLIATGDDEVEGSKEILSPSPNAVEEEATSLISAGDDEVKKSTSEDTIKESGGETLGVSEKTLFMSDLIEAEANDDNHVASSHIEIQDSQGKEQAVEEEATSQISVAGDEEQSKEKQSLSPKAVLKFIAPTLALWIAPPVMSLIDTSAVGRFCGASDLAALSPGCTLIDSSSYLFFFIATAATNLVASTNASSDDREKSDRIVSEALFLALISGIGLGSLVLVAGTPLLSIIAGEASLSVVPSALKYALVRAFGQPFVVMASVARAAALAEKDTKGPLLSVGLAFILNVIGTLTLVTQTPLGIMGAAIGTLCADVASTGFLLTRMKQSRRQRKTESSVPLLVVPSAKSAKTFLQYAAPIFFTILGKSVVYNGIALSVGRLGSVALAAHQVLLRGFFFWCPVGDSVGMTSQVFLPGVLAKEKRTGIPQRGAKRLLFSTGVGAGLVAAILAFLLPSKGAALFTANTAVEAALKRTAPILGLSVSMHAIALTCEGMLLAQRDLGFLSKSYIITTIATIGLLLSPFRPATLGGSWWILAMFQLSRSIQFTVRNVILTNRKSKEVSVSA